MNRLVISIKEYEKKAALFEENRIVEFFIERVCNDRKRVNVGNIYKGKIVNILSGMDSIFIDIGSEKNAFLHMKNKDDKIAINTLNKNDSLMVQIENEERDKKGAKLTLDYSIPGKYLVYLPKSKEIGFSKKIENLEEIERLREILSSLNMKGGVILRTSAQGANKDDIEREYKNLFLKWQEIQENFKKKTAPSLVHSDDDFIEKLIREFLNDRIDEIVVDNEYCYEKLKKYALDYGNKSLKNKLKKYNSDEDLLDFYEINQEIQKALERKVWLNCGGYLIIEKTEALVSIDVNTGKNIGNRNLDKTVLETNLEAATEIPRQLRLRNLAGIIIIDFIDMSKEEDKKLVLETLEKNLKKDRLKNNIVHFTSLGLVEMTRKRRGFELSSYLEETCPYCEGKGQIKSVESVCLNILKEIDELGKEKDLNKIELLASKEIIKILNKSYKNYIITYLESKNKKFLLTQFENEKINFYKLILHK